MNESEDILQPKSDSGIEGLRNEVQALRAVVSFAILLMFVFSICVNVFLLRQAKAVGEQAAQASAMVKNFDGGVAAQANDFWVKVNDYARTHPDYQPIIAKYNQVIKPPGKK